MPAMYEIVTEDGKRLPEWPDPVTHAEAQAICRGEWALGVAAYMKPAVKADPATEEEGA